MHRLILAAVIVAMSSGADAQLPRFDGRLIPARTDTFVVRYAGDVIGRGIMERKAHGAELVQVYVWTPEASTDRVVDSLFLSLPALRTLREVRVLTDSVIAITFLGDTIVVEAGVTEGPRSRGVGWGARDSHSSAALEALALSAPLRDGYSEQVQLFCGPPIGPGFAVVTLRVERSENVRSPGVGLREAWVVTATTPSGDTTFWIDKATRMLLQYDTREGTALIEFRR